METQQVLKDPAQMFDISHLEREADDVIASSSLQYKSWTGPSSGGLFHPIKRINMIDLLPHQISP